jgi:hypothetical protein
MTQSHDKILEQLQDAVEDKERINREKVIFNVSFRYFQLMPVRMRKIVLRCSCMRNSPRLESSIKH